MPCYRIESSVQKNCIKRLNNGRSDAIGEKEFLNVVKLLKQKKEEDWGHLQINFDVLVYKEVLSPLAMDSLLHSFIHQSSQRKFSFFFASKPVPIKQFIRHSSIV